MSAKIVVVDDSRTQRSTIALALERLGYQVVQGSNGLEAIQLAEREQPDLMVSDIVMPELTGYQVCRLLKNDPATEDLPIILLTTLDHQEHRFWGREAGADSYVVKEADTAHLEKEVARLLAKKKRVPKAGKTRAAGTIPLARQTAHARLTDILDRLLFDATVSNLIREIGRRSLDLTGVVKAFFDFFPTLIDYDIALLCLRTAKGPLLVAHFTEKIPPALFEAAKGNVLQAGLLSLKEKETLEQNLLTPDLLSREATAAKGNLAMLSAPFSVSLQEGGLAVFTANAALYTEETARTLKLAAREIEPILSFSLQSEAMEQLKADFTAMIVHDLRSPLTAVMSGAAIVEDELVGPVNEEQKKWLAKIGANSKSLLNLINDVLDLSKIEAGRLDLMKEDVDMEQLIRLCLDDCLVLAQEKKIALKSRIDQPVRINADPGRLGQIFANLLSNAIKFTGEGGEIEVGAAWGGAELGVGNQELANPQSLIPNSQPQSWVRVWVKDSGAGIPADEIGNLFEKYRQTTSGKTSRHKGTGLGLVICKKIAESHGGKIWVESEEGKGTTFFFSLPVGA